MDNHERVVKLALCFDAVIFGGYIRDTLIRKEDKFNDIDILWYNTIHNSLNSFLNVLFAEPWVTSHKVTELRGSRYGDNRHLVKVEVNNNLNLDIVVFHGTLTSWLCERDCDFSCNLFYKSRKTHLALRYIPDCFDYYPDPFTHILNLTKEKKFVSLGNQRSDRYWKRISGRGINLVKKGWLLQGDFIDQKSKDSLGPVHRLVMRSIRIMERIMNEDALDVISPKINEVCKDKIRRKLFESDTESDLESHASCPGLIEDPE